MQEYGHRFFLSEQRRPFKRPKAEEAAQEMRLLNAEKLLNGVKEDGDDHTDAIDDSDPPFSRCYGSNRETCIVRSW